MTILATVNGQLATLLALPLAISDGWILGMWLVNLASMVAMGIVLAWVANRTRRIETLEGEVRNGARQEVDLRIQHVEAKLAGAMDALKQAINNIERRLQRGDDDFDRQDKAAKELEGKLVNAIGSVKDYIRDTCAQKRDLEKLGERVDALVKEMAR